MKDVQKFADDLRAKMVEVQKLTKKIPDYVAGAAEKMKDANFAAQGFVVGGSARPCWKKRKKESSRTQGKRILHNTGTLQNSVKIKALSDRVTVGVDLSKVPYAKAHNEGGKIIQHVRPFTRGRKLAENIRTHRRVLVGGQQVKGFTRRINMPKRQFLGYSPDIFKSSDKDIRREFDKIFK